MEVEKREKREMREAQLFMYALPYEVNALPWLRGNLQGRQDVSHDKFVK